MSSQNTAEKKANRNSIDMLHGPLVGKLFLFAIPLAFSSIFQQLFNSTDAIVAGRLLGSAELAAIGGVAPLTALFISFFVGVSIGTNATIAIRIGQGDRSKIRAAVHTTAVIAIVSAVLVTVIGIAIAGFLIVVAGPRGALGYLSRGFIRACLLILGLVAVIAFLAMIDFTRVFTVFHEIFFSQGNWMFDPRESRMINMLPEGFFSDCALRIASTFVGAMLAFLVASGVARQFTKS